MTTFGSVCSGIEAASVAWDPLGLRASWFAEIEPFPSAVLAHRWPSTPNLGDMTKLAERVTAREIDAPDVLVGGTPCQAFSVAGLRKSLEDSRGQLSLSYCRLANAIDAVRGGAVIVWENVPGVLSTKDNAFGCFLAGLAGEIDALVPPGGKWSNAGAVFGPTRTVCWRILDAQYFGVAQRRRRVFVVASARKGFDPCAVLFESKGVRRDSAPGREQGEGVAVCPTLRAGGNRTGGHRPPGTDVDTADSLIPVGVDVYNGAITGDIGSTMSVKGSQCAQGPHVMVVHGTQDPCVSEIAHALGRNTGQENAVFAIQERSVHPGLNARVRRLTPVECERLQGFPDDYTRIPNWNGWRALGSDETPERLRAQGYEVKENQRTGLCRVKDVDGPRYRALGNSMARPVMQWIGERMLREMGD